MRTTLLLTLALASLAACAESAGSNRVLSFASHYDVSPTELLPLARSAAADRGYRVTDIDEANNRFVAVAPDQQTGVLVSIATPGRTLNRVGRCRGACQTVFSVTPLAAANGHLVVPPVDSPVADERARVVLGAIEDKTSPRRYVQMY
jgi:hypothetical protein